MTVVDVHAHVIVPELLRDAAPDEAWRPSVRREDGAQVIELDGRAIRAAVGEIVDVDEILAAQDHAGVERVVLCPWVPLLFTGVEPQEGLRRCRLQNEALGRLVRERPERISALGGVPLQDPELAGAELAALMGAGELSGVEVPASVGDVYLGDERHEPFWAAAEATGALVFVHPTTRGFAAGAFAEHYLWNLVGNPTETTITAAHMVMSGVLERHPALRVVLAHGGGTILALRGRLRHGHEHVAAASTRLQESPEESLRRLYYDTVTFDPGLVRELVAFAGADHVLLGSDSPFDMGDMRAVDTVRAAGLAPEHERAVLGANAERLLGLTSAGQGAMRA
jgi:aminocarboxymuconate-semialdehyde decarboxylase